MPYSGSLPQNAAAVVYSPGVDWESDEDGGTHEFDVQFECTEASGATREIAFEIDEQDAGPSLIRLQGTLVTGELCSIVGNQCGMDFEDFDLAAGGDFLRGRAEFRVTEAADLPTELGTVTLGSARLESIALAHDASCSEQVTACVVRAELELSDSAAPWRDALMYETFVDGKRWAVREFENLPPQLGGSYLGRGKELFYSIVSEDGGAVRGLSPGPHTVVVRATLPGTDVVLETAEVALTVSCAEDPDADAGADPGPAATDGGLDGGAGDGPDGSAGGRAPPGSGPDDDADPGCGCRVVGSHHGSSGGAIVALLGAGWLLAARRRRRLSRRSPAPARGPAR